MKTYAIEQGMQVPAEAVDQIAKLGTLTEKAESEGAQGQTSGLQWMTPESLREALLLAFSVHGKLATLVKPATPDSLEASKPGRGLQGSGGITRLLFVTTIGAIVAFAVGTWLVSNEVAAGRVQSVGRIQVSYVGAALLGASFAGLYTAYKYISTRTYDPVYNSTYVSRLLLGTVSGLILANFGGYFIKAEDAVLKMVAPTALALIGGYSADAVNLILQRVADTLVAAVRGTGDEATKAKQAQLQVENKAADLKQRQATASELGELLALTTQPEVKEGIQKLMASLGKGEDVSGTVKGK
jgi:hypothetical protein